MKGQLFVGNTTWHALEATKGTVRLEENIIEILNHHFPGGVEKGGYTLMGIPGPDEELLFLSFEVAIDERASHEVVHSNSFNLAHSILGVLGKVLEDSVSILVESIDLRVEVYLNLVSKNQIYERWHYEGKGKYEHGTSRILQVNTEALS